MPTGLHSYGAVYSLRLAGTSAAARPRREWSLPWYSGVVVSVYGCSFPTHVSLPSAGRSRVLHEGASLVRSSSFLEAERNALSLVGVIV